MKTSTNLSNKTLLPSLLFAFDHSCKLVVIFGVVSTEKNETHSCAYQVLLNLTCFMARLRVGSEFLGSGHIRFSGSFTSLTSLSVEGANESEIELSPSFGRLLNGGGLCNKEAQDKSFAAMDDTFLTSRDTTCQQSILLQKKPAYQGKGREEMLCKVGQTNVFAWYIWKVGLEFV